MDSQLYWLYVTVILLVILTILQQFWNFNQRKWNKLQQELNEQQIIHNLEQNSNQLSEKQTKTIKFVCNKCKVIKMAGNLGKCILTHIYYDKDSKISELQKKCIHDWS